MKTRLGVDHAMINYSRITPGIYLGTNACCQRHFDLKLLRRGITADISLEAERIDAPRGVDYFLWLPTPDHSSPSQKDLDLGSQDIDWFVRHKEKVYVHCKNGHGRSPTLLAAYFIRYQGMTVQQAITAIKHRRSEIHLEASQRHALEVYARHRLR
ncbi:MAG: dual specificity protein phosphatase family protein [Candidatus Kerfeldbacteria bacterium]|nr:dual specificity protein phosphatase family protein [Candidatus Kerfeldbacteria bacterium]